MAKLANPWKCDAPGCGKLRANDTNHWLILRIDDIRDVAPDHRPMLLITTWADHAAERPDSKHACGIDCGLKIAAQLIADTFFPEVRASATGKEGQRG